MERLKAWLLPVYAVFGFLAIILILPSSRWVVMTQLDVVAGRWKYRGGPANPLFTDIAYVYPIERGLDDKDPEPDETSRFWRLVAPTNSPSDNTDVEKRFRDLFHMCQAKGEARNWAQFVRVAAFFGEIQYPLPTKKPLNSLHNDPEVQRELRDACIQGERLDPSNAFFSAMLASVLNRLGDLSGSRAAYIRASNCTRYEDYVRFEADSRYQYLVSHYGDRGHQIKASVYAEVFLQHLSPLFMLSLYFSSPEDKTGRLATLKLASLMMDQSKSAVSVIVAKRMASSALDPSARGKQDQHFDDATVSRLSKGLASELGGDFGIARAAQIFDSVDENDKSWAPSSTALKQFINLRPLLSAWSLWSLCLLPAVMVIVWRKSLNPRFSAASPYLAWLMVCVTKSVPGSDIGDAQIFIAATLLSFPALFPKIQRYVDWVGILVAALAAYSSFRYLPLIDPTVIFIVSLILERRAKTLPTAVTAIGVILISILAAGLWVSEASQLGLGSGLIFGTLALFGASAAIPVRAPVRWAPIAGSACLVLGLWYGVMVSRDIVADKQMVIISDKILNDADEVKRQSVKAL